MGITLKEIAEMAGVHRSTVDKVLHNRGGVSDKVSRRIKKIIEETNYHPNTLGQALQKKQVALKLAAVLFHVDAFDFIQEGISQALVAHSGFDIDIQYYTTDYGNEAEQLVILNNLIRDKIDGIILSPVNTKSVRDAIDRAADAGIPIITTMNFDIPKSNRLCFFGQDTERAGKVAASLFGEFLSGHGNIAIIAATEQIDQTSYSEGRRRGFIDAIKKHYPGLTISDYIVCYDNHQIIERKTRDLLKKLPPDGIFITGGGVPLVGKIIKEYGYAQNIKTIGFERFPEILELINDDIINCTIDSDMVFQGQLSVDTLLNYLVYKKTPEKKVINTRSEIIVKGSLI